MGEGVIIHCESCGFEKELSFGFGFLSNPWNPETREDVLKGKYGKRPQRILEENPDDDCIRYAPLFHYSCGNLSVKDAVLIRKEGEILYRPSMRCDICQRKMWEINDIPERMRCPKCGSHMVHECTLFWD